MRNIIAGDGVTVVQSGHEDAASWRANRTSGVGLSESNPFFGQPINVGSGDGFAAVATGVAIAKVVRKDEDDVGPSLGRGAM